MRLTKMCRGLLWGGAFALLAAGCKDDNTNSGMDSGTDAGSDSGPMDSGQDAGPALPVYLRLAHLAFGTGVGPVHICARDGAGNRSLLTTDALATGNFRAPNTAIPFPYGSVTRHLVLDAEVLSQIAGRTIEVFKASEAGVAISGNMGDALRFATCTPTGSALDSATVGIPGSGAEIELTPGQAYTFVIAGSAGTEISGNAICTGAPALCPAPHVMSLSDTTSTASTTDALIRPILLDGRNGMTLGFCSVPLSTIPTGFAEITAAGTVTFGATPAYVDAAPLAGASAADPKLITLHTDTSAACALGTPFITAGAFANALLIGQYQTAAGMGQPVATIRPALVAGEVSTLFIAPFITEFFDIDGGYGPCTPSNADPTCVAKGINTTNLNACAIGTANCVPGGTDPDSTPSPNAPCVLGNPTTPNCTPCTPTASASSCMWVPMTIPVADTLPAAP